MAHDKPCCAPGPEPVAEPVTGAEVGPPAGPVGGPVDVPSRVPSRVPSGVPSGAAVSWGGEPLLSLPGGEFLMGTEDEAGYPAGR